MAALDRECLETEQDLNLLTDKQGNWVVQLRCNPGKVALQTGLVVAEEKSLLVLAKVKMTATVQECCVRFVRSVGRARDVGRVRGVRLVRGMVPKFQLKKVLRETEFDLLAVRCLARNRTTARHRWDCSCGREDKLDTKDKSKDVVMELLVEHRELLLLVVLEVQPRYLVVVSCKMVESVLDVDKEAESAMDAGKAG